MKTRHRLSLLLVLALSGPAWGSLPQTLNYQGRMRTSGGVPVPDSPGNTVVFRICADPNCVGGGDPLWTETWNTGTSTVDTKSGLFNVVLGTYNPLTLPFDQQYYLEINFNGDGPMTPRQPLTMAPYAFNAKKLSLPYSGSGLTGGTPVFDIVNTASGGAIRGNSNGGASVEGDNATAGGYGIFGSNTGGGTGVKGQGQNGLWGSSTGGGAGVQADQGTGVLALQVNGASNHTGAATFSGGANFSSGTVNFAGATVTNFPAQPLVGPLAVSSTGALPTLGSSNSGSGVGLSASASSNDGIYAFSNGSSGIGVHGIGDNGVNSVGVVGAATAGKGVFGSSNSGTGVAGQGKVGVYGGIAAGGQTAVLADYNGVAGGVALKVSGPARFDMGSVTFNSHVDFSGATVTGWNLPANIGVPLALTATGAAATLHLANTSSGPAASIYNAFDGDYSSPALLVQNDMNGARPVGIYAMAGLPGASDGIGILATSNPTPSLLNGSYAIYSHGQTISESGAGSWSLRGDNIGTGGSGFGVIGQVNTSGGGNYTGLVGTTSANPSTPTGRVGIYAEALAAGQKALVASGNAVGVSTTASGGSGVALFASAPIALSSNGSVQFNGVGRSVSFNTHVDFSNATITGWSLGVNPPLNLVASNALTLLSVTNTGSGPSARFYANNGDAASSEALLGNGFIGKASGNGAFAGLLGDAGSNAHWGVQGLIANNAQYAGVWGNAGATIPSTPASVGVVGSSNFSGASGVWGEEQFGGGGAGVVGKGVSAGVSGTASGIAGVGVQGIVNNSQGIGVFGSSAGSLGAGVSGTAAGNSGKGVFGTATNNTTGSVGVYGRHTQSAGRAMVADGVGIGLSATASQASTGVAIYAQGPIALSTTGNVIFGGPASVSVGTHIDFSTATVTGWTLPLPAPFALTNTTTISTLFINNTNNNGTGTYVKATGTAAKALVVEGSAVALSVTAAGASAQALVASGASSANLVSLTQNGTGSGLGVTSNNGGAAIVGFNLGAGDGVMGEGDSASSWGVYGLSAGPGIGVYGQSTGGMGVAADGSSFGVSATASAGNGVAVFASGPVALSSSGNVVFNANGTHRSVSFGTHVDFSGATVTGWNVASTLVAPLSVSSAAAPAVLNLFNNAASNGRALVARAQSALGVGVSAEGNAYGLSATSASVAGLFQGTSAGISATAASGSGLSGFGVTGVSAYGTSYGLYADGGSSYGVWGQSSGGGVIGGVTGSNSGGGPGVYGTSTSGHGIYGTVGVSSMNGVRGDSSGTGAGVFGQGFSTGPGMHGQSNQGNGVEGVGPAGNGVSGTTFGYGFAGVLGMDNSGALTSTGVVGTSGSGAGVKATGVTGVVAATNASTGIGVLASNGGFTAAKALKVIGNADFSAGSVTFAAHVDFGAATVTGWNVPALITAPLYLTSSAQAWPNGVISGHNTGSGFGLRGDTALPGSSTASNGPDLSSTITAGVYGYTATSLSAGVLGVNADSGNSQNAAVMGLSLKGIGVYAAGSTGLNATATDPTGYGASLSGYNHNQGKALHADGAVDIQANNSTTLGTALIVSQSATAPGAGAIGGYTGASGVAAVYGENMNNNVPTNGTIPGVGVMGKGTIGVVGFANLSQGAGVIGTSNFASSPGVMAQNQVNGGMALNADASNGTGGTAVQARGLTAIDASTNFNGGVALRGQAQTGSTGKALQTFGDAVFQSNGSYNSVSFFPDVFFMGQVYGINSAINVPLSLTGSSGGSILSVSNHQVGGGDAAHFTSDNGYGLIAQGYYLGLSVGASNGNAIMAFNSQPGLATILGTNGGSGSAFRAQASGVGYEYNLLNSSGFQSTGILGTLSNTATGAQMKGLDLDVHDYAASLGNNSVGLRAQVSSEGGPATGADLQVNPNGSGQGTGLNVSVNGSNTQGGSITSHSTGIASVAKGLDLNAYSDNGSSTGLNIQASAENSATGIYVNATTSGPAAVYGVDASVSNGGGYAVRANNAGGTGLYAYGSAYSILLGSDMSAGSFSIKNLSTSGFVGDAVSLPYLNNQLSGLGSSYLSTSGGNLSGALNMGGNRITSLATPSFASDAANKSYVDGNFVAKLGDTMTGQLSINTSGSTYGLDSVDSNSGGIGVHGKALGSGGWGAWFEGAAFGVKAESSSTSNAGVWAANTAASGAGAGLYATSANSSGYGVWASNQSGGTALMASSTATALIAAGASLGVSATATGGGNAVFARNSAGLATVLGVNDGSGAGLSGSSAGTAASSDGVFGQNNAVGAGNGVHGVLGTGAADADTGNGVFGENQGSGNTGWGVRGVNVFGSGTANSVWGGVQGQANNSGVGIGVAAVQPSSQANLTNQGVALQVTGPVRVSSWTNSAETDSSAGSSTFTLTNPRSSGTITLTNGKASIPSYTVTDTNWVGTNSVVIVSLSGMTTANDTFAVTTQTANSFTVTFSNATTSLPAGTLLNFLIIRQQ